MASKEVIEDIKVDQYQSRPYRLVIEWVNDNPTPIIPLPPLP